MRFEVIETWATRGRGYRLQVTAEADGTWSVRGWTGARPSSVSVGFSSLAAAQRHVIIQVRNAALIDRIRYRLDGGEGDWR